MSRPSATKPGGRRKARCRRALFGANGVGHPPVLEENFIPLEAGRQLRGERRDGGLVPGLDAFAPRFERHQPVEGAAVEVVKAERPGDLLRNRALARRGRTVDGDDRHRAHAGARREMPASILKYSGNVLSTQAGSLIRTRTPPSAASENDIAMR
jgi:hypothetical protein